MNYQHPEGGRFMHACTPPRLLSLRAASQFLSLSVNTVRSLIRCGELRAVRSAPRSKVLVDIRELESFCTRNTQSNDAREEVKNNE